MHSLSIRMNRPRSHRCRKWALDFAREFLRWKSPPPRCKSKIQKKTMLVESLETSFEKMGGGETACLLSQASILPYFISLINSKKFCNTTCPCVKYHTFPVHLARDCTKIDNLSKEAGDAPKKTDCQRFLGTGFCPNPTPNAFGFV